MFSSSNNSTSTQETWRVFGRLTQKFGTEETNSEKSSNLIKNAYITIKEITHQIIIRHMTSVISIICLIMDM